ncbi:uncharacterized protein LOC142354560 [Convolutriloba macropyga]|uniref:uncharacterized protein LOC142354560 n=1 Tax=Convolutriloba macropyga TaxID=536237 RepID=UPI003F521931
MIADLTCLAINASCIDPNTWEFLAVAFGDQGLLPGASYIANIHSSTGPTESLATVIQNIQKPLPVENLVCVEFYEDVLKLEWSAPRTGSVIGFHVTLEHPDGSNTSHPVKDLIGFTETELTPGSTYKFYVSSYSDQQGLVRSEPVLLVQGTIPKEPSKVEASALVGSDGRSFTISAVPPIEGAYKFFQIVQIQDNSAFNFIQTANDSSQVSKVFQNSSLFNFPMVFPINSTDTTIHMAKFGTVYSIKVGSVSDFGLPSLSSPNTYIFTATVSDNEEETGEGSGSSFVWLYVGIGLGVVIVFLIVLIVVVKHVKRSKERRQSRMETAEESVYMNPIIVPDHENSTVTSAPDYINRIVGEQRRPIDEESARDYLRQQAAWNGNSSDLNRHLMVTSFVNQMQRNQSLEYVVPIFEEDFSNYQLPIMMENEYDRLSISSITVLDD